MSEVLLVACLNRHFVLLFQKLCKGNFFKAFSGKVFTHV